MAGGEFSRSVRSRFLVVAALAALLAGCNGGTVDRHALTNDAATLDSIACEGALLAHDVARGQDDRVLRARAGRGAADPVFEPRGRACAGDRHVASIEQQVRAKAKDAAAARGRRSSGSTTTRPTARSARDVERQLKRLGGCA